MRWTIQNHFVSRSNLKFSSWADENITAFSSNKSSILKEHLNFSQREIKHFPVRKLVEPFFCVVVNNSFFLSFHGPEDFEGR